MSDARKNVVFIIVDSLRADYLSCYGANRETPGFDAIADRGVRFENTYASGPNTPISHSAMFSGQHPSETGVVLSRIPVPEDVPLISSWFRKEGYETMGFSGPSVMGSEFGFDRGFDSYYEQHQFSPKEPLNYFWKALSNKNIRKPMIKSFFSFVSEGFDDYTGLKIDSLEQRLGSSNEPLFFMANLMTPHHPYLPPRPYLENATEELDRPRWGILEELGVGSEIADEGIRDERVLTHGSVETMARYLADPSYLDSEEMQLLRDWYHAAIRYTGDQLSSLVASIEAMGALEDTLVVITSDHGDFFGEHDLVSHSHHLHEEVTRVPLFVLGPEVPEGTERTDLASHVDLFDTICDLAGIAPPETTSGISLFGEAQNTAVFSEHGLWKQMRAEQSGKTKYMSTEKAREFTAGRKTVRTEEYRFEIDSDGNEQLYRRPDDGPVSNPEVADDVRDVLVETVGDEFVSANDQLHALNDDIESNLKELGYIE